jgi:hypothetical protein
MISPSERAPAFEHELDDAATEASWSLWSERLCAVARAVAEDAELDQASKQALLGSTARKAEQRKASNELDVYGSILVLTNVVDVLRTVGGREEADRIVCAALKLARALKNEHLRSKGLGQTLPRIEPTRAAEAELRASERQLRVDDQACVLAALASRVRADNRLDDAVMLLEEALALLANLPDVRGTRPNYDKSFGLRQVSTVLRTMDLPATRARGLAMDWFAIVDTLGSLLLKEDALSILVDPAPDRGTPLDDAWTEGLKSSIDRIGDPDVRMRIAARPRGV